MPQRGISDCGPWHGGGRGWVSLEAGSLGCPNSNRRDRAMSASGVSSVLAKLWCGNERADLAVG